MTAFRFAVLTAVSSDPQASDDKDSLDHQLKTARAYGERMGGTFLQEFRIDGQSRTDYYDLSQAFSNIPALGELAQCIARRETDVVFVESYDRLGDLAFAFLNFLKPYRVQFRSVQQALPIEEPALYDPRKDDATVNMIATSMVVNKYRINKIVRAFEVGNPKRARDGKYGNQYPYGYLKGEGDDLILDERVAALLRQFPAWFLSGVTVSDIARRANESGLPPRLAKSWNHDTIRYILQNPFYAGKVFYGRGQKDPTTKHYKTREKYDLYDGRHEALWTWDTHLNIMAEFARRRRHKAKPSDYNFTKLLECSECGAYLSIVYSSLKPQNKFWRCLNGGHVQISQREANRQAADELVRLLKDVPYTPTPEEEARDHSQRELAKIESQFRRTEAAYDAGAYTPVEFAEKIQGLKARREELQDSARQASDARRRVEERQRSYTTMQELLPGMHKWIAEEKPRVVNFHLQRVVRLVVQPDKTVRGELL
jgi:hypothetical protein